MTDLRREAKMAEWESRPGGVAAETQERETGCRAINTSQVTGPVNEGRELVTF